MTTKALTTREPTAITAGKAADWKKAARNWGDNLGSDRTRRSYLEAWRDFIAFATKSPDAIDQGDVIAYRRYLETTTSPKTGRPYSQSTINLHLSAMSSFFTWAVGQGLRADNPTDGVNRKAVEAYGKATWLDPESDQDRRLLEVIDASTAQGKRDKAIMLTFLTMGFRVSEVAGLQVGQLRRQADQVFLTYTRKRGKTREVKLPDVVAQAIIEYLNTRPGLTDTSPLFTATDEGREAARHLLAAQGRELTNEEKPLTARAIGYLVESYCDRAFGKGHGIHPHSLRHTAAQVAVTEGHPITAISDLLGHASLQVTTVYLHATNGAGDKVSADLGRRYTQTTKE